MAAELILVVDDTPANLRLAEFLLKGAGFTVHTASGADELRSVLAKVRPVLILMDLQLPGVDGFTLTRQLRADPETRDVRIVAMTAYAMTGDEARARDAGCDDYLAKPIDPITFAGTVRRYLRPVAR